MRNTTKLWAGLLALALAPLSPAAAQETLKQRVETIFATAAPGTRFGLVVATEEGREVIAISPDERFIPASNTKMFTTAAAFATLPHVDRPDTESGTRVRLEESGKGPPSAVLEGRGDARLSSAADCAVNCLAMLADAVAAKTRAVRDVVGDDSFFPDQRWSPGMSWNNIPSPYGTGISSLTLDDNEVVVSVAPAAAGEPPRLEHVGYYRIDNRAVTVRAGATSLSFDRFPGTSDVRLTGTILAGAQPERIRMGIDDPAHYAAWRFKSLLEARGVRVTGDIGVRHRRLTAADDPKVRNGAPAARAPEQQALARLTPPPLLEDLTLTNKVSQNAHSELLLRRVGRKEGSGSIADGVAAVRSMMDRAGVPRTSYDFSDGSGMSTYNRLAPRGTVAFLRWVSAQPWGGAWRATLPVAGVDGTLTRRFVGTQLQGKLFAKTGSLNATSALSGYMIGKSGRTLLFSIFANDVPDGMSATKVMDSALEAVAEAN
jgi:D-alanyl-D-alanine carboxypeptidase/D-alanyl-D-alanine-endopeptidase (penicillin-binding protein 4)